MDRRIRALRIALSVVSDSDEPAPVAGEPVISVDQRIPGWCGRDTLARKVKRGAFFAVLAEDGIGYTIEGSFATRDEAAREAQATRDEFGHGLYLALVARKDERGRLVIERA